MKKQLAIFGPYPPPLGGISVHIQRLEHYLKQENIPYLIYNHYHFENEFVKATHKSKWWYLKFLWQKKHKVVHFHQFSLFHFPYYFIFSLINPAKLIISIHNEKIINYHSWKRSIILWFLKNTGYQTLISVSEKVSGYLNKKKITNIYLPAYVPATSINPKKLDFPKNKIPFLFSVWKVDSKTAEDVYNISLILRFLKKNKDRFFMVMMIGSRKETDLTYLKGLLSKYQLDIQKDLNLLFDKNLVDYFPNFAFLIRTNSIDAYGVSLQEAMDAGIPAIATDVCKRPAGTILFKSNDLEDMEKKIKGLINKDMPFKKPTQITHHLELIKIYKNLLLLN